MKRTRQLRRRGQGTVELALMIPLLLALLFMGIELAFFFGAIHWDTYAAFAAARAVEVGDDGDAAASLLLDGNVTSQARPNAGNDRASVYQPWDRSYHLYGLDQVLGTMSFTTTVVLGREEARYENRINARFADNNL
jgi:Flp pilus assembly protein TadG